MKGKWFPGLVASIVLKVALSQAGVLFSDNFSYSDGPLVTVAEGKWKTHSGTAGQAQVTSRELRLSHKQSEDVSASFGGDPVGPITATAIYASFKVKFASLPTGVNGGYFAHFKDTAATTGFRCRIFATTNGAAAGRLRLGIAAAANTNSALLPRDLSLQTSYRVVCRMALANNESTLWLNPRSESDTRVVSTDEAAVKTVVGFAFRQSLASGAGMGELTVDDLVVATSFAETALACVPIQLTAPLDQTVSAGSDITFRTEASGTEPLSYQWLCNGTELPDATDPVLVLSCVTPGQAGAYQVLVSNCAGTVTSPEVILTVTPPVLHLTISRGAGTLIQLHWLALHDWTYSVWAGDSITAGFSTLASGLAFPDGAGLYEDFLADAPVRFYQVCSP